MTVIIEQLQQVRVEASDASKRLKELQSELVATKERCSQQTEDLNRKSGTSSRRLLTEIIYRVALKMLHRYTSTEQIFIELDLSKIRISLNNKNVYPSELQMILKHKVC